MRKLTAKAGLLVLLVVTGAVGIGLWSAAALHREPRSHGVDTQAEAIASVPLLNEHGGSTTLGQLRGKAVVLFFGYASCPDICPTSLAYMAKELHGHGDVQGVFVSLDPERDRPEDLGRYVHYFDPQFMSLTGTEARIAQLTKLFGVYSEKQPPATPGATASYTYAHTGSFFILAPNGSLVQTLSPPFEPGALLGKIQSLAH